MTLATEGHGALCTFRKEDKLLLMFPNKVKVENPCQFLEKQIVFLSVLE